MSTASSSLNRGTCACICLIHLVWLRLPQAPSELSQHAVQQTCLHASCIRRKAPYLGWAFLVESKRLHALRFARIRPPSGVDHGVEVSRQRYQELNILIPHVAELEAGAQGMLDMHERLLARLVASLGSMRLCLNECLMLKSRAFGSTAC